MKYNLNFCGHTYVSIEVEADSLEAAEKIAEEKLTEDQTSEELDKVKHTIYWNNNFISWIEGKRRHSVSYIEADDDYEGIEEPLIDPADLQKEEVAE